MENPEGTWKMEAELEVELKAAVAKFFDGFEADTQHLRSPNWDEELAKYMEYFTSPDAEYEIRYFERGDCFVTDIHEGWDGSLEDMIVEVKRNAEIIANGTVQEMGLGTSKEMALVFWSKVASYHAPIHDSIRKALNHLTDDDHAFYLTSVDDDDEEETEPPVPAEAEEAVA